MEPPCVSIIRLHTDRPSPVPVDLPVTYGWKQIFANSSDMPTPVSDTETPTRCSSSNFRPRVTVPPSGKTSMAFKTRLTRTCRSSTLLPHTTASSCRSNAKSMPASGARTALDHFALVRSGICRMSFCRSTCSISLCAPPAA